MEPLFVALLIPLVSSVSLLLIGKRLGNRISSVIATLAVFGSFLASAVMLLAMLMRDAHFRVRQITAFEWMHLGALKIDVAFLIDPLSVTMMLFVTGVSALIHLYSIGYMSSDERAPQFFAYLNLFVFSMLVLVSANNLPLLFAGWEGVGVCSYFLIGYWFHRNAAASAAKKAFIVNRIGDVGLLLGIFLTFVVAGTVEFSNANREGLLDQAHWLSAGTVTAIGLLFFVGAVGKSAQLPLFVWLPDAMEGPTPVSALIHAATMVTAGVYLMARIAPIVELSSTLAMTIAVVGSVSAIVAALAACAQDDIKRVLAYSTMSQLGYMFLAVGAGMYTAGIFHMVTHAFFKALLFLAAGAVIHALIDEQNLKKMGGLRRYLPLTFGVFVIGSLALSGIPPFAGFWSKDEILLAGWEYNRALWAIALLTAFLTAYYMTRLVCLAFFGSARFGGDRNDNAQHVPHEAPITMIIPMVILAFASVVAGVLQTNVGPFRDVLTNFLHIVHPRLSEPAHHLSSNAELGLAGAAFGASLLGILLAVVVFRRSRQSLWPKTLEPGILSKAWYVDTIYEWLFAKPGRLFTTRVLAVVDHSIIDGMVRGTARAVSTTGIGLRKAQSGLLRSYAVVIAAGVVALLVWALIRSGNA